MRPPCCSTMLRHSASPSPVPPSARESEPSPCWNRSKMRSRFSGTRPRPWFLDHETTTAPASRGSGARQLHPRFHAASSAIAVPGSENLIALPTSSLRTCNTRSSSTNTGDAFTIEVEFRFVPASPRCELCVRLHVSTASLDQPACAIQRQKPSFFAAVEVQNVVPPA